MTQNPLTPSGSSWEDDQLTTSPGRTAYDDTTSETGLSSTSNGAPSTSTGAYATSGSGQPGSVRDEAASVRSDAVQSGRQVADTAVSEVKDVVGEARTQITTLFHQLRSEATDQASGQSDRAVQGLRTLGDELKQMAASSGQNGLATDLAGQAADRVHSVAGWLEQRQPGEVLDEVRDFARRRPGTFLAAAAVVGLIGGRLTRGLTAGSSDSSATLGGNATASAYGSSTTTAYGSTGDAYAAGSSAGVGTDPSRLAAGTEPVAFTQPRPAFDSDLGGAENGDDLGGFEGVEGVEGAEYRQGLR